MKNFAGLKGVFTDYNESKFFVLPVPYSTQNDWNPMASRAPEAIVEASQRLELYDTETRKQVWQKGIHYMEPLHIYRFGSGSLQQIRQSDSDTIWSSQCDESQL